MAVTPRIFVSATTGDLRSHRATVAAALRKLESHAIVQDDWPPDYQTVEQLIRRRIRDSDAVIHLVGLRYGAEPRELPPGVPRRSYTQMEYHIARELKKPVYLFVLPENFPYDQSVPEEGEEQASLQRVHRAQVLADTHLHYCPSDAAALHMEVFSLQPLVEKLRAALRRQRLLVVAAIAALIAVSGGIGWAVWKHGARIDDHTSAIAELQKPESPEVKFFKEIQLRRSQTPAGMATSAGDSRTGGGDSRAGREGLSYPDALAAVATDHQLTADALRGMLDAFSTRVLADPSAGDYERAVAEFHRRNFESAVSLATTAAENAEKEMQAQRDKAIESWTLAGDAERERARYREALNVWQKARDLTDQATDTKRWLNLSTRVATMRLELAERSEAESLFREILPICEKVHGSDAPNTAVALNNLAILLMNTRRTTEAEPLLRRALAIDESFHGPESPQVGRDLNNLAQLLDQTSRLAEAEPLMKRALAIAEATSGPDHPTTAMRLSNLAQLLKDTNRPSEAEPLMRRVLAIDEAALGKDHPTVARDLNNLVGLLKVTGRIAKAEPYIVRALAIDEATYAKGHPHIARDLSNLAMVFMETNRSAEAEPLLRRAIAIQEAALGKNDQDLATMLSNLGQLLQSDKKYEEAEPLLRRSLTINETVSGKDHPDTAVALNNLARLFQDTNRLDDAEPLMRRMVEIFVSFTAATKHQHPYLKPALKNYKTLCQQMGDTREQAEEKIEKLTAPITKQ